MKAFMIGAPLAFAGLLTQHPMDAPSDFYSLVADDPGRWLAVHYGAALLFPLMAGVVWWLLRGVSGRAATVARAAMPVYAILYGVYEAMVGLDSGMLAQEAQGMSGAERAGVADAINGIPSNVILGEGGVFGSVGGLAWVIGVSAAIVALNKTGVQRSALALLGVSSLMIMHIPPIGPVCLICLSAAALLIERRRPAPAGAPGRIAAATA
jgi:hypothetical protein